jgi:hypothetical protein
MTPHPWLSRAAQAALAVLVAGAPAAAQSPVTYARAEQLLPWNTDRLVSGDEVRPEWLKDGTRFWYRNKLADGSEFVLVDPVANARRPLFDHARLARALTLAADTAFDGRKLPFQSFRFGKDNTDESEIEFTAVRKRFTCNLATYRCVAGDTLASEVPFVPSPDKVLEAFIHKNNLWVRNRATKRDSVQLTTDGVDFNAYGITMPRPSQLQRPMPVRPNLRWSPDGKRIAVLRQDERFVEHMHYISYTPQRPKHYSQPYALPGDTAVPHPRVHIVEVATKANIEVRLPVRPNNLSIGGSVRDSAWAENSQVLHLSWLMRGSKGAYLAAADAATGAVRIIARDTGKTYVEIANPQDPASFYVTKDLKDAFWWSERDGWGHLYRFDGAGVAAVAADPKVMSLAPEPAAQLTSGAWQVGQISHVDEVARQVYFTARGRDGYLYYPKLYRVGYDGSGLTLLTPEDGHHVISFSPGGKYFVDTYSRIEAPPVTVLRSAATGAVVRKLEEEARAGVHGEGARRGHRPARRAVPAPRAGHHPAVPDHLAHLPRAAGGVGGVVELQGRRRAVRNGGAGVRGDPAGPPGDAAAVEGLPRQLLRLLRRQRAPGPHHRHQAAGGAARFHRRGPRGDLRALRRRLRQHRRHAALPRLLQGGGERRRQP